MTALEPEHLSAYSLIIEEGTPFYDRFGRENSPDRGTLPDEEAEREMYHLTKNFLERQGYLRYEISNYAARGFSAVTTGVTGRASGIWALALAPLLILKKEQSWSGEGI